MPTRAKRIIVHGMVQGVGFRYFVHDIASQLELTGNVRNCPDSTVEIVVEGDEDKIAELIKLVKKGPPLGWVQRTEIVDIPVQGAYGSFFVEGRFR
jgi:acylphosphatase